MKIIRFILTFAVLLVTLNGHAQDEDEDIAYSLHLAETVVLPEGMTFEEYLLKKVLANSQPLKKRVRGTALLGDLPTGEGY